MFLLFLKIVSVEVRKIMQGLVVIVDSQCLNGIVSWITVFFCNTKIAILI